MPRGELLLRGGAKPANKALELSNWLKPVQAPKESLRPNIHAVRMVQIVSWNTAPCGALHSTGAVASASITDATHRHAVARAYPAATVLAIGFVHWLPAVEDPYQVTSRS